MKYQELLIGILAFTGAHILTFFQLNGQFKWEWFKSNELLVAVSGVIISFLLYLGY